MKYLGIFMLVLSSFILKGQDLYSNYIFNPFGYWSFGTAVTQYNDTAYIQGDGGQTVDYRNLFVAGLDSSGFINSEKKVQRPQTIFYSSRGALIKTSNGIYSSGFKLSIQDTCGYVYKFDNEFNLLDSVNLKYNNYKVVTYSFVKTLDNCFAVSGYLLTSQLENGGIILFKMDSNLNILWSHTYQVSIVNRSTGLVNTQDNGFLITGMKSNDVMFSEDPLVIKTDSNGYEQWLWYDGSSIYDDGPAVASIDNNGGYFISYAHGIYQSAQWPPLPSQKRIRLVKINEDGQEQWSHFFGITNVYNRVNNMFTLKSNDCLINYHTNFGNCGLAVLLRTTSEGDSTWLRYYIYNDSIGSINEIMHVCESDEMGYLTIGENFDPSIPGAQQSVWIMHLDSLGCQTPECNPFVGIKEIEINSIKCYPNPATKLVSFKIPESRKKTSYPDQLKASVFSNNGSFIESYVCKYSEEVTIDLSHLLSGIYFISFYDGNEFIGTAKFLKL